MRSMFLAVAALFVTLGCGDDSPASPDAGPECSFRTAADEVSDPAIHTPRWAFEPWISKDISDRDDTYAFLGGFQQRDIPVGVVVLDSPWETNYNTFIPNPDRYPDFDDMVSEFKDDGVRVVLWITQMINETSLDFEDGGDDYDGPSPNLEEARTCDFLVDRGATYFWWKGFGSGLDFFNPEAAAWWHRQQDDLLDLGIAGWKLDFGEQYLPDEFFTAEGTKTRQEYSELYYQDYYAYGASRLGTEEFVTMVRPYDKSYQFEGRFYARPEHAPVAWVGDNRRDWVGLIDALDHLFRSADAGYVVIGSDIGGYLDLDDVDQTISVPFDSETLARWTAVGALTPFMQLHGRANLTPWTVPEDPTRMVALYRYWSWLHSDLVPFFYSLAEAAYAGGPVIMRPEGALADWDGDYRYMLGDAFLVAPFLAAGGTRDVELPAGNWHDWWQPGAAPIAGGQTLAGVSYPDWERIPLYVKAGAIVPMNVRNEVTGLGTAAHAGKLTVAVWPLPTGASSFALHEDDGQVTTLSSTTVAATSVTIDLSRTTTETLVRIVMETPTAVQVGGNPVSASVDRAAFDAATAPAYVVESLDGGSDRVAVTVKVPASTSASSILVTFGG